MIAGAMRDEFSYTSVVDSTQAAELRHGQDEEAQARLAMHLCYFVGFRVYVLRFRGFLYTLGSVVQAGIYG